MFGYLKSSRANRTLWHSIKQFIYKLFKQTLSTMKQVFMQIRKSAKRILIAAPLATVLLVGCDKDDDYDYPGPKDPEIESTVISGSGDISTQIAAFRSIIGDSLNTAPGAPATGRREVNWDGVPPDF